MQHNVIASDRIILFLFLCYPVRSLFSNTEIMNHHNIKTVHLQPHHNHGIMVELSVASTTYVLHIFSSYLKFVSTTKAHHKFSIKMNVKKKTKLLLLLLVVCD